MRFAPDPTSSRLSLLQLRLSIFLEQFSCSRKQHDTGGVMNDKQNLNPPAIVQAIQHDTTAQGFPMASESQAGSLLRTLAATKPAGSFLELGTGTGLSTAWILAGMDQHSRLLSVDNDEVVQAIARRHLGHDPRVTFKLS